MYYDPFEEEQDPALLRRPNPVRNYAGTAVAPPAMTSPTGAVPPPVPPPANPPEEDYPELDSSTFQGAPYRKPANGIEAYERALAQPRPKPSIGSRLASAALGFGAGWLNASGKRGVGVDPRMVQSAAHNMQYGGYDRDMERLRAGADLERQKEQLEMTRLQREAYRENIESMKQDRIDKMDDRKARTMNDKERRDAEAASKEEQRKIDAAKFERDTLINGNGEVYTPPPFSGTFLGDVMPPAPRSLVTSPFDGKQFTVKSKTEQEQAKMISLPKPITDALQLEPGMKVPPNEFDSYVRTFESHQKNAQQSPQQALKDRTEIANSIGLNGRDRQVYLATGRIERPPTVNVNTQAANDMDDDTIDFAARQYKQTGQMPSLGMGSAALRSKILKRAAALSKEEGVTPEEVSTSAAGFQASKGSLSQLKKQQGQVLAFERTAVANLDLANSISQKVDRSGSPLINKYVLFVKGQLAGDSDTIKLKNAVTTAASEYAKVISGSMGNTAVTDSLRKETESMLNAAFGKGTFNEVVAQMKQEMNNRKVGYSAQIEEITGGMKGPSRSEPQQQQGGNRKQQFSPSTGQYRHSLDGGKTWQPGKLPQ